MLSMRRHELGRVNSCVFLTLPSRIRWPYAIAFAGVLCLMLMLIGSDPVVVCYTFAYILVAVAAFNVCGGFTYPSGAWIFFNAFLTLILGLCLKVYLWEKAEGNLLTPRKSFLVYLLGMIGMWGAALVNRKVRAKRPLVQGLMKPEKINQAVLGTFACGSIVDLIVFFPGAYSQGSLGSALMQMNVFLALSIMLAVFYNVKFSGGRKSMSIPAMAAMSFMFVRAVGGFTKQGMFMPVACWMLSAVAAGYYASKKQILLTCAVLIVMVEVLVPYSQYGRNHREEYGSSFNTIVMLISHPTEIIEKGKVIQKEPPKYHFFNEPQGIFDRLNMISMDDGLIYVTDENHQHGFQVIVNLFINIIPHFILPDKPPVNLGNIFAHEIGLLDPMDTTTGVSFSPTGEAYHSTGISGVLLTMPLITLLLFWTADSLVGDVRVSPWGLSYLVGFSHMAPEGGLTTPVYMATYGVLQLLLGVIVAMYIAPLVGTLLLGPERNPTRRIRVVRSVPKREAV